MEWIKLFSADTQPSEKEISEYINSPLWEELNAFLNESYEVWPAYSYSACSMQSGWNVKYQKAGKSLCTLYPMEGFFIALVVIGAKEAAEAELLSPTFTDYVQNLMKTSGGMAGSRWLMISVTNREIFEDVKALIQLRRRIKKREK
ncbi:DUF3788 domain-containing protein [Clostridiaceae bacterium OttesenSCG-928-D20]|nr:DUF3788 domain-containing protein [Clostridiaceae bacterium OttesenSCG-928-D20]